MQYRTRDFYIGTCILASGHPLLGIERTNDKFSIFVFKISPEKAEKIIQQHWDYSLKLPSRKLTEAINELKTRVHSSS